jgi:hypothetical protein
MPAEHLERVGHILAGERRSLSEPTPDREHEFRAGATPAGGPCQATSAPTSLSGGPIPANASKASSGLQTWPLAGFVATRSVYVCEGGNQATESSSQSHASLSSTSRWVMDKAYVACCCFEAERLPTA